MNVAEFSRVTVEGDENLFEGNKCGEDGGVFASTVHTLITVEGGTFKGNTCELVSHSRGVAPLVVFPICCDSRCR